MGLLDLFERNQSISMPPQPNEGTELPSYYELHRSEILTAGAILVSAVLIMAVFRYRAHLRNALLVARFNQFARTMIL
jgi:hypothetical protein